MTTEFDFTAWKAEQNRKREARRVELQEAIARGLLVRQCETVWSTAGVLFDGHRADTVFIESAQSNPAYLANHLESREFGFGFPTHIIHVS